MGAGGLAGCAGTGEAGIATGSAPAASICWSCAPQLLQKRAPSGFCQPQALQKTPRFWFAGGEAPEGDAEATGGATDFRFSPETAGGDAFGFGAATASETGGCGRPAPSTGEPHRLHSRAPGVSLAPHWEQDFEGIFYRKADRDGCPCVRIRLMSGCQGIVQGACPAPLWAASTEARNSREALKTGR